MNQEINTSLSIIGWNAEQYKLCNTDLAKLNSQQLSSHFITHGLQEGRNFLFNRQTQINIEKTIFSKNILIIYGWSEIEFESALIINTPTSNSESSTLSSAIGYCIRFWRDDVANHLLSPIKNEMHGFILIAELQDEKNTIQNEQLSFYFCAGGRTLKIEKIEKKDNPKLALIETYRHLQNAMVYSELMLALEKATKFVEKLSEIHRKLEKLTRITEIYNSDIQNNPKISIGAVVLGNSSLLKKWLVELSNSPWASNAEINIFCNGPQDIDQIISCCKWYGSVANRQIKLFFAAENIGFNCGVNYLTTISKGDFTLITNIDVSYRNVDLKKLTTLSKNETAICIARQFNSMGALQHLGMEVELGMNIVHGQPYKNLITRLNGRNTYISEETPSEIEVDFFGAAALFGKTSLLRMLGPFDTRFLYAYHEDTDLAIRAKEMGVKMLVTEALEIIHYESSGAQTDMPKSFLIATNTTLIKHRLNLFDQ